MLHDHFLAFDEHLPDDGAAHFTSDKFARRMAKCDQLAIFAVVADQSTTGTMQIQLQHAGDGIHYVDKATLPEIDVSIPATVTFPTWGFDAGEIPSLPFVRLRITLDTFGAHVKIYVALRDTDSDRPDTEPGSLWKEEEELPAVPNVLEILQGDS